MSRVMADCRTVPSEKNCTLVIAGEPEEVTQVASRHAIEDHGHEDSPELRQMIQDALVPETMIVTAG